MMIWLLLYAAIGSVLATKDPLLSDPSTIIYENQARFTILSPQLIRLEWSPTKDFVDGKTWVVQSRQIQATPPAFNLIRNNTHLRIETAFITLEYLRNTTTTFSQHNIRVTIRTDISKGNTVVWSAIPGEEYDGNLLGTLRTLDGNKDAKLQLDCRNQSAPHSHCTYGVISRRGYAIIDDTHRPQFDNDTQWAWIVNKQYSAPDPAQCTEVPLAERRNCSIADDVNQHECELRGCCFVAPSLCFYSSKASQDLYLFGHGHSYAQALYEFTRLSGAIPLPPRYIFGVFYSRYWAYAEYEARQIITEYIQHDIPLDVLVTDMDWHITFYNAPPDSRDQAGQPSGWTGYTFNKHLFPHPQKFLQWCKQLGLKITVNLHPASGIQPWEEMYEPMARAMGIDPSTNRYVPLNLTDKKFSSSLTNIVLKPLQEAGIDLWWLDWQQGEQGWMNDIPYANPTFWLNYIFTTDPDQHQQQRRLVLLHRWGGLGNHRYQVGFSSDVHPSWETLSVQPRFTATAANVGYGYWSHDLGGYVTAPDPELYIRWIQWGTFSPIFRIHSSKSANNDRRLWTLPWAYQIILARFTRLRQALVPYLYTAARRTYDTGLAIVLPLYYHYPQYDQAYSYSNQYLFGESILVSPISQPINNGTDLVENWPIWFPPDVQWVNFLTGDLSSTSMNSFALGEMPVYAKVGSIIPLLPEPTSNQDRLGRAQQIPQSLLLYTLIGGSSRGHGYIYEDDGISTAYQDASPSTSAVTQFDYIVSNDSILYFNVSAASGAFSTFPIARSYEIQLRGVFPAATVLVNNILIPLEPFYELFNRPNGTTNGYAYDGSTLSIIIYIRQPVSTSDFLQLQVRLTESVSHPLLIHVPTSFVGLLARCQALKTRLDYESGSRRVYMDDYPFLLDAAATGLRITHSPSTAKDEVNTFFAQRIPGACNEIAHKITNINPNLQRSLLSQLQCNLSR